MSSYPKPSDPNRMMGVYKSLEDVPDRRRFYQYSDSYAGRDVWMDYFRVKLYSSNKAHSTFERHERIESNWKTHMQDRGNHHALATPNDVEAWSTKLLDRASVTTARWKWDTVRGFYNWLVWHTDHPHVYDPFLMAAAKDGPSATIWEEKLRRRKQ